ncbi:hypothetical protein E4U22_007007 [Claviceps purpurea]|nr:hypothetical protein E4U22_007007 [Claviceps purpurea]
MAAIHKQQQADQRTKLNRGRRMPHRAFPQMYEQYSPLRWHEQHGDGSSLSWTSTSGHLSELAQEASTVHDFDKPVIPVIASRHRRCPTVGFLADNVVLRNHASNLDLPAGSLIPRGERPPGL